MAAITSVHAKTVLTEFLAEKYLSPRVDANSFHPGMIRSDLMQNLSFGLRLMAKVLSPFFSESCETGIYACSSHDIEATTGNLFSKKKALLPNSEKRAWIPSSFTSKFSRFTVMMAKNISLDGITKKACSGPWSHS